jgi:hypothetical protein
MLPIIMRKLRRTNRRNRRLFKAIARKQSVTKARTGGLRSIAAHHPTSTLTQFATISACKKPLSQAAVVAKTSRTLLRRTTHRNIVESRRADLWYAVSNTKMLAAERKLLA